MLDAFPKPLINEFLTHVRDVVKYREKWDRANDAVRAERAAKGQQRFGPRNVSREWQYGPSVVPPPYEEVVLCKDYIEMVQTTDCMFDWTGRACGLHMEYWINVDEEGDVSVLQDIVLRAVRVVFKIGFCKLAPFYFLGCPCAIKGDLRSM